MASERYKLKVQSSLLQHEDSAINTDTHLKEPLSRLRNIATSNALRPDTLFNGNEKTIGTVLEEFKNKALLSLQREDSQIQLVGPFFVVTNGPRAFSLFKPFEQQPSTKGEEKMKEGDNDSANKRSLHYYPEHPIISDFNSENIHTHGENHIVPRDTQYGNGPAIQFEDDEELEEQENMTDSNDKSINFYEDNIDEPDSPVPIKTPKEVTNTFKY